MLSLVHKFFAWKKFQKIQIEVFGYKDYFQRKIGHTHQSFCFCVIFSYSFLNNIIINKNYNAGKISQSLIVKFLSTKILLNYSYAAQDQLNGLFLLKFVHTFGIFQTFLRKKYPIAFSQFWKPSSITLERIYLPCWRSAILFFLHLVLMNKETSQEI